MIDQKQGSESDSDSNIEDATPVPSLIGRAPTQTSTFAFVRSQGNRKTPVSKVKAPVKSPITSYAQLVRWSFASTVVLIALVMALISIAPAEAQPPFYPFALLAGALGAFMSLLIRVYNDHEFSKLVASPGFIGLKRWDLTVYALVPPIVGILAASTLFIAFAAGILQGGALFPVFSCELGEGQCGSFAKFIYNYGPSDATDYARTLIWCFVAGFAERLVPDKLRSVAMNGDMAVAGK
jgi:hypothetical protein